MSAPMTMPEPGDRLVLLSNGKWYSYCEGGHRGKCFPSRKAAFRHARRMLEKPGSGRLLEIVETADGNYRLVKRHVR